MPSLYKLLAARYQETILSSVPITRQFIRILTFWVSSPAHWNCYWQSPWSATGSALLILSLGHLLIISSRSAGLFLIAYGMCYMDDENSSMTYLFQFSW